jgi:recombination protein RecA
MAELGVVSASRISERPAAPTVPFGVAEVDALTGGLPRGGLTEICGAASSGRTSLMLAAMAEATRRQELCALVDVSDSFDPHSAASAGVDLDRLLWIRCRGSRAVFDFRSMNSEWKNRRRAHSAGRNPKPEFSNRKLQFARIEQALRAADLLLQAGGFGLVVMDLADVPSDMAQRIPLTSWFRFRRAVENTPSVLLVLEQEPHARSCASLVVRLRMLRWRGTVEEAPSLQNPRIGGDVATPEFPSAQVPTHARVLDGLQVQAEVLRDSNRKPPGRVSTGFASQAAWGKWNWKIG